MSAIRPFPQFEKPLSDDPGRSCTMPARYYTDPDIYEREKEVIFARTRHYIGHESHVRGPGDYLTLDIADETLGREDQDLCESVQRGLRSRSCDHGRLMVDSARSGTAEHGVHQFHRLVTQALDERSDR